MTVFYPKCINAVIVFCNGADALHTNTVSGFMGYRNIVFKWDIAAAGIFNLQEKAVVPDIKLYVNHACFFFGDGEACVKCIFECI